MIKEELIGLVKLNLGNAGDMHENQVHLNIALAWEQMLSAVYYRNPQGIDRYCITYPDIEVKIDQETGRYYSDLPMVPIKFNDIAEGLRRIYKKKQFMTSDASKGDDIQLVPMPPAQTQLLSCVDAGMVSDVIGYFVKGDRVYYYKHDSNIETVYMDIVPPFDKFEHNQEIPIPSGGVQTLIGIAQEILKGTPYVDPRQRKINIQEI